MAPSSSRPHCRAPAIPWVCALALATLATAGPVGCGPRGAGASCRFNTDCEPGLICGVASGVCEPIAGPDGGFGTDAGGGDATPGTDSSVGADASTSTDAGPGCGNGVCDPGETPCGCEVDCGLCVPTCGDGVMEGAEPCDDGNLDPGDGCGPVCNLEIPCIRTPLPTPMNLGMVDSGSTDDGQWELDISPSAFAHDGGMHSLFSIATNGYVLVGSGGMFRDATGYQNSATDPDARFGAGASIISWLAGDGTMNGATHMYDHDVANDRLVLAFGSYGAYLEPASSTDVQIIFYLSSGSFEILYLSGNFIPHSGATRDWGIGVSEPALGGSCAFADFATWTPGTVMTLPLGCIANHMSGSQPGGSESGSHYTSLAGHSLCFVKGATDYEVSLQPLL